MAIHVGYEPATGCTGGPRQGARALMSYYLGAYGDRGAAHLGIYACKTLGSGWSIHAEGRACDLGTAPYGDPAGGGWPGWGWDLANALLANSAELGIQAIIFRRRIWSGAYPHAGWRHYTGSNPHDGHLHTELTRAAAATLTAAYIDQVIGGKPAPPPPPEPSDWRRELIADMKTLDLSEVTSASRTWIRGADVRRLQGWLLADGHGPAGLVDQLGRLDGIAGPGTRRLLGDAQRKHRTGDPDHPASPDYVAGSKTWGALGGVR